MKGASVGIGLRSVLRDLGVDSRIRVHTDAAAAKAIASWKVLGKVRHIEVNQLWIQNRVGSGDRDSQDSRKYQSGRRADQAR